MTNLTENVAKNVANEKVQDYVKKSHNVKENEPKSEKTAQDVQKNCSSLTEQWKNGELEQGYYYTKYNPKVGEPFVEIELRSYLLDLAKVRDADTVEVLAPVPSYEEWQKLNGGDDWLTLRNKALNEENDKLKELLGKCYRFLILTETKVEAIENVKRGLVKEIDEVLK